MYAAKKLLLHIDPQLVDFVLFILKARIRFSHDGLCDAGQAGTTQRCGSAGFNLGCSGYIYGLCLAKSNSQACVVTHRGDVFQAYPLMDKGNLTIIGD